MTQRASSTALRALGGLEQVFWRLDESRPLHFVVAVEVSGPTTVEAWRGALTAAQQRHPLLSCAIGVADSGVASWSPTSSQIPLRVVGAGEEPRWDREVGRELATPFPQQHGPLARAVLLHSDARCTFLLAVHHAVTDGRGAAFVIRDVLRALAGQPLAPYALPPSQEDLLRGRPTVPAVPAPAAPSGGGPPPRPSSYREPGGGVPSVQGRRLTPELTAALRERARREAVTVHAALSAAVLRAAGRSAHPPRTPLRIFSPIDIRSHVGLGDECVLALSCGAVALPPEPATPFWELALRAWHELHPSTCGHGVRAAIFAVEEVMEARPDADAVAAFGAHAFAYDVILTNLGAVPLETAFGPLTVDALWGPAVLLGYEGEQTIGVATLGGSLALLHTSHAPVPGLLEAVERELVDACG